MFVGFTLIVDFLFFIIRNLREIYFTLWKNSFHCLSIYRVIQINIIISQNYKISLVTLI